MENEILNLKKQMRLLQIYAAISSALFLLLISFSFTEKSKDVIKTKGIIVQDEQGRDRILIGSPAPYSPDRVRTDFDKVEKVWAPGFGGKAYMDNYKTYNHDVSGIVFLNEAGYDRLVVGDKHPDPNTGKRLVEPTGITWNDDEGFERGGLGISKTEDGKYRVVMGMDDNETGEALHMFILEDGTKALRIAYDEGYILLGKATPGNFLFQTEEAFSGILIKDNEGNTLWEQNALKK